MQASTDAYTVIDVYTHPFSARGATFSGQDDVDERAFYRWLTDTLNNIHFASIVLSQNDYSARLWLRSDNRISHEQASALAQTAVEQRPKVQVVGEHLKRINPKVRIETHPSAIEDEGLLPALAQRDWLLLATDNHASRFGAQRIALRFGIPLISEGVNIQVANGHVEDMSGEVITARLGDGFCRSCVGRIGPTQVAAETVPGLGGELARRGYVADREVKEPAVKKLNAILAARAVDALVNQYTGRQTQPPILVYEDNQMPSMYPDTESLVRRPNNCFQCAY